MNLSAVLFDVGGTIAESEEIHRISFNEAFKEYGLSWYWDEAIYKELICVGGGKERINYYIKRAWPEMLKQKNFSNYVNTLHRLKSQIYVELMNDMKIKARPGVLRLLNELREAKIRLAIVSDTLEQNLINLFKKGLDIDPIEWFEVIAHGDCVDYKKPAPDLYMWALEKLQLHPDACLAIEDAPRGMISAHEAGLKVIITPSKYTKEEKFDLANIVISDLGEPNIPFKLLKGQCYKKEFVDLEVLEMIHSSN
tara:strand:+ start:63 stop:821 length:759 start_codon:yes stop_codon:yes gene_type:complete